MCPSRVEFSRRKSVLLDLNVFTRSKLVLPHTDEYFQNFQDLDFKRDPIFELAQNLQIKRSHSSTQRNFACHYRDEDFFYCQVIYV